MVKVQQLFRLGSKTGKKRKRSKEEFFEVHVVFDNHRNYDAYQTNLVTIMKMLLPSSGLNLKRDWEQKTLKFSKSNNKCIICKDKQQMEVTMRSWRKHLKQMMVCNFKVETDTESEQGIVRIILK